MPERTVGAALRAAARDHGDITAIVDGDRRVSYRDFDRDTDRFAKGLLALDVAKGDHVGLWAPTRYEWMVAFAACVRIGAIAVPVNTRYRREEAEYILKKADIKVLVTQRSMWSIENYAMLLEIDPEIANQRSPGLRLDRLPELRAIVMLDDDAPPGTMTQSALFDVAASDEALRAAETSVTEDSELLICFTSGSTGNPKGVLHAHRALRHARRIADRLRVRPGDAILVNWPMHHVSGLFLCVVPAFANAATQVLMAHWLPERAIELIDAENISVLGGISTHFFDLVDECRKQGRDISSVKSTYIGGATLPRELFDRIVNTLGLERLLSTYGMTENTVSTTFNKWDDPIDMCARNKAPVLTEGPVKVVDPETFRELPVGQAGEIWCSGPTVMMGYYKEPEATAAALTKDGWLRTGDLGVFDADGNLEIVGRIKDILKIGGSNVSPTEVENFLTKHAKVNSAVVIGVPDPRMGEVAYAYVQLNPGAVATEAEIIAHCRSLMADYKVPRYVKFVDSFPRLSTGKIERRPLIEDARKEVEAQLR